MYKLKERTLCVLQKLQVCISSKAIIVASFLCF